jgi:hypothetical protein
LVEEVVYMSKLSSTAMLVAVIALFIFYAAAPAYAGTNGVYASPGTISQGGITQITVTTDKAATGRVQVRAPDGTTVWFSKSPSEDINIPPAGGSQHWTFPDDFEDGANTNNFGSYEVKTSINWISGGTFMVEFFVYPELPLGAVMAVGACFAGLAGYRKLKK